MMERYKALVMCVVSDDDKREALVRELTMNMFEPLNVGSVYGLPLETYQVKVQPVKALLRKFCRERLSVDDTALFFESRMNQDRTLSAIVRSDLLTDD